MMRIVVMGRTCSGKSTFVNILKEKGLEVYKTYTTRPQRDNTDDGYHFITEEKADSISEEEKCVATKNNGYQYFGKKDEILNGTAKVFVLDPDGFYELSHLFRDEKVLLFYINADSLARVSRALKRTDGLEKFQSRDASESKRFFDFEQTLLWMLDNPGAFAPKNVEVCKIDNSKSGDLAMLEFYADKAYNKVIKDIPGETPEQRKRRLNLALYNKICSEQSEFIGDLLKLTKEGVLPYAKQYAIQHNIAAYLGTHNLEEADAEALLNQSRVLWKIFKTWEDDLYTEVQDTIKEAIIKCAADSATKEDK